MRVDREKIVMDYLPLVKYVVDRLPVASLPQISRDDLISSGVIGLLKAADSFDPSRGIRFKTYAIPRIRGAIIDELRKLDWIPRSLRKKADLLEETYLALERKLGRTPTDKEISQELNICEKDLYKLYAQVNYFSFVSLDAGDSGEEGKSIVEKIASTETQDPVEILKKKELEKILRDVLEKLPVRERLVVVLYYYEELTLKEIGRVLGISESRVSQIHARIMVKLRSILGKIKESLPT